MSQSSHPTLINLPPPSSTPDTPSEMPGTPTSTTTSLSALSTTAIKDGHRGHLPAGQGRGHAHHASTTSLEAERADRISRLAGLERVSTLRAPLQNPGGPSSVSHYTTPISTGFPSNIPPNQNHVPPYFDANGQPVAPTKMSTVGTASATESYMGDEGEARTTMEDQDEDMHSTDTNYREAESVTSMPDGDGDVMDEDLDGIATRSMGGYEDRMSDDGSASLVGFGEGAGSTISGPIYQRRPLPGLAGPQGGGPVGGWMIERRSSGLSDSLSAGRREMDVSMGGDTPVSVTALRERREARMVDGVAADAAGVPDDEMFVDTTTRGPVSMAQLHLMQQSTIGPSPTSREAAERIVRERLDQGEGRVGGAALGSPGKPGERLGKFYFEERK